MSRRIQPHSHRGVYFENGNRPAVFCMKISSLIAAMFLLPFALPCQVHAQSVDVNIMSFNVWSADAQTAKLAEIIQAGGADIVGLQEMNTTDGQALANHLGWHHNNDNGVQIISRHAILGRAGNGQGALIEVTPGHNIRLFNVHFPAYPYQPYMLRDNPSLTEVQLNNSAEQTRGEHFDNLLNTVNNTATVSDRVFITGDFNEPSHLDWTAAAAAATPRTFDKEVSWVGSRKLADAGFTDSFRAVRPDVVNDRGYTWTPGYSPPDVEANEVHDRIDIVYSRGLGISTNFSHTIGLDASNPSTDIGVTGYNSDHRAVVSGFTLSGLQGSTLTFSRLQHNPSDDRALNGANYGDRLATTSNIEVEFTTNDGSSTWDTYDGDRDGTDNNWNTGVAQLQGSPGSEYDIQFTPDDGFGVVVDSFDLVDYRNFAAGHTVNWELWQGLADGGNLLASGTESIAENGINSIATDFTDPIFGLLTLRLEHVTGDGTDLAIDNVSFHQVTSIPEPNSMLWVFLLALLVAATLRSRRRKQHPGPTTCV